MPESTPNYRDLFLRAAIYADKMMVTPARSYAWSINRTTRAQSCR
jgi:hypothetical protein